MVVSETEYLKTGALTGAALGAVLSNMVDVDLGDAILVCAGVGAIIGEAWNCKIKKASRPKIQRFEGLRLTESISKVLGIKISGKKRGEPPMLKFLTLKDADHGDSEVD